MASVSEKEAMLARIATEQAVLQLQQQKAQLTQQIQAQQQLHAATALDNPQRQQIERKVPALYTKVEEINNKLQTVIEGDESLYYPSVEWKIALELNPVQIPPIGQTLQWRSRATGTSCWPRWP